MRKHPARTAGYFGLSLAAGYLPMRKRLAEVSAYAA